MPSVVVVDSLPEVWGSPHHWRGLTRRRSRIRLPMPRPAAWLLAAMLALSPAMTGEQDVADLLATPGDGVPRWMQSLIAPDNVVAVAGGHTLAVGAGPGRVEFVGGRAAVTLAGFGPPAGDADLPEATVLRGVKTSRRITLAARTAPGELSAGSLVHVASFVGEEVGRGLPRVAFVNIRPVSDARALALSGGPQGDRNSNNLAAVKARVEIAQAVAATSASMASAYAGPGMDVEAPFRAFFSDPGIDGGADQEVTPEELAVDPHAWVGKPLPASVVTNPEQRCLSEAIYFEARGEPYNGQVAVAQVVLNRVRNPAYPDTICAVVYQNRQLRNRCQFSFACDLVPDRVADNRAWRQAQEIAREATAGRLKIKELEAATHYHAVYVKPYWAPSMQRQSRIGQHVFYKTYGGGWS